MVKFYDTIAVAGYDIDIHNPEGTGTIMYTFKGEDYYYVPYRSILPKEYDNMLVVGRCLSANHEAHSAVRVMPTCACIGEAAGIAISIAKSTNTNTHTIDIELLRKKLKKSGAIID